MRSDSILKQLEKCGVIGGTWIDAGSGNGTFTFPLSSLASKVIALDTNKNNLSYLRSKISRESNIESIIHDFNKPFWYSEQVDGILFGFSLHYDPNPATALKNAYLQLKTSGKLVVFEYSSEKSVPWVPYPIPSEKLLLTLNKLNFRDIQVVKNTPAHRVSDNWNNASYTVVARK